MAMKKNLTFIVLFLLSLSFVDLKAAPKKKISPEVKELIQVSQKSSNKLPLPTWPYQFDNERLFQEPLNDIDKDSVKEAQERFYRMLHALYLKPKNTKEMLERAHSVSAYIPEIDSYVKNKMFISNKIMHISVYGSFLYNMTDPDDVDMLIIVDSPYTIFEHADVNSEKITGKSGLYPKFSFQVIDYNSYMLALGKTDSTYLSRAEKMVLQHVAVGSSWYFTIFGLDFRFDNPNSLTDVTKVNYLNKSIVSLNGAGARLYKSAYSSLPFESERIRLRKVVSRILISDFLIPVLDKSIKATPTVYTNLYDEIRLIKDHENKKWKSVEKKIQKLYFQKLEQLLSIAEKQGKLDEIMFRDK